jgi:hypothetical protein
MTMDVTWQFFIPLFFDYEEPAIVAIQRCTMDPLVTWIGVQCCNIIVHNIYAEQETNKQQEFCLIFSYEQIVD